MLLRWSAVACWLTVILVLTFLPGSAVPKIEIDHIDLIGHFALYGVLAVLLFVALLRFTWGIAAAIILASAAFGILTEIVQEIFVPGRYGSVADGVADILGAVAATVAFVFRRRRIAQVEPDRARRGEAEHSIP
jgi:VanZ family protein